MSRVALARIGWLALGWLALGVAGLAAQAPEWIFRLTERPAAVHWVDFDGVPGKELLAERGNVLTLYDVFSGPPKTIGTTGRQTGFLYDWGDVDRDGRNDLVIVDTKGVWVQRFENGRLQAASAPVIRSRRGFDWRFVRRVPMLRDVDRDGLIDLVQPTGRHFRLVPGKRDGGFDAARACSLPSGIRVEMQLGGRALDRELKSSFRIPDLLVRDVDGDGRPDLILQLGSRVDVHRGSADGFGFADQATWTLDLSRFSTGPKGREGDESRQLRISMGRVQLNQDDLDGDGVGDFLVASGQKVWIFFAGRGFRGFRRPDRILRVSDDIAGVFPADVDGDGRTDLVLVKFAMPSMTRLVAAMIVGINLEIEALAFRNHGDRSISRKPDRTNRIEFAVPPILSILGDLGRFESKMKNARNAAKRLRVGDANGDGVLDVAVRRETDRKRIDLFLCEGRGAVRGAPRSRAVMDRLIRDVLFDRKRPEWTIDSLVEYVGDLRFSLNREQIAGRKPAASLAVDDGDFELLDVNGDGKADVVSWRDGPKGRRYIIHRSP